MATSRKYEGLLELDSAPDIYETPELTDDTSTLPATTIRSPSDDELDDAREGEAGAGPISRSRLRVDEARSRFMPSKVEARDVDFSDRLGGKRRSYITSSRRARRGPAQHAVLDDGTEALGDLTDEEDHVNPQVGLAHKIARLKREVAEAKALAGEQQQQQQAAAGLQDGKLPQQHTGADQELALLSKTLEEIARADEGLLTLRTFPASATGPSSSSAEGGGASQQVEIASEELSATTTTTYTVTYAPTYQQTHALAKAADMDRRLAGLEKALGVGSSGMAPELDLRGLPRAVIPTLDALQRQVSTLSEASTASLDSISRRVRALTQEAEALEKARKAAKAAQDAIASASSAKSGEAGSRGGIVSPTASGGTEQDMEQTTKINALYGTIPTIESLAPLLPPLLDRLRSLRAIHADAAAAAETLARLETKQADMAADIQQWREGLEKVEKAVQDGDVAMEGNMKTVEGWVKVLEEKMAKLA